LDFENEAKNSERCAVELNHLKFIVVPKVFWKETSKVRGNSSIDFWGLALKAHVPTEM
jgi:hypothetical protein